MTLRQQRIANTKFALSAASCAVCPCLAAAQAFGAKGPCGSPGLLGPARVASHVTKVLVGNQHSENEKNTRPPCEEDLQTAHAT